MHDTQWLKIVAYKIV